MKVKIDFDGVNVHLSIEAETSMNCQGYYGFFKFYGGGFNPYRHL